MDTTISAALTQGFGCDRMKRCKSVNYNIRNSDYTSIATVKHFPDLFQSRILAAQAGS